MEKESFFHDVYEVARLIPIGRVTTYGAIAQYLGVRSSARVVGWAMNDAISKHNVPAHRVVNRIGILTGKNYFGTPTQMQELLEQEGISIEKDQIVDFENVFWDPAKELSL